MSGLECRVDSVAIIAEEGKKYRISAGTPIPAVFWLTPKEMIALRDCINKILECVI
jgi:hypothetical protein